MTRTVLVLTSVLWVGVADDPEVDRLERLRSLLGTIGADADGVEGNFKGD